MSRFHVYRLRHSGTLVVDLQADLFEALRSRIVAPLIPASEYGQSMSRLNPHFPIDGELHIMATHLMAAVSVSELGDIIADLSSRRDDIVAATDFAFQGF